MIRLNREAEILRERRIELHMTQAEVAAEIGTEVQNYQRYEYGESLLSNATMRYGLRICAVLELDPYEVVFSNSEDVFI